MNIDTHIHAPQFPIAGVFGSKTLLEWLDTYTFPTEASFKDLKRAKLVYERVVTRTLSHGTTTASYYATIHVPATNLLSAICFEKGQRALIGRMCMDCNSPEYYKDSSVGQAIKDTQCTIEYIKQIDPGYSLIRPIITPRFAIACSRNMMSELGKLAAKENLQIQTHISENEQEIDRVRKLFPECKSYADVYDNYGVLGPRTILGHAVHLSKEELALVKLRESKLSHCPVSNAGLGSGIARVRDMLDAGVDVGLGSDVSGGYSPSILEASRHALLASRLLAQREKEEDLRRRLKLQVEEVLYLGTLGGAKVVGLEGLVGNFVVGKEWDALLVQLHSVKEEEERLDQGLVELFDWQTKWEDRLAKWVYCGDDRNNLKVWVRGKLVYERKEVREGLCTMFGPAVAIALALALTIAIAANLYFSYYTNT